MKNTEDAKPKRKTQKRNAFHIHDENFSHFNKKKILFIEKQTKNYAYSVCSYELLFVLHIFFFSLMLLYTFHYSCMFIVYYIFTRSHNTTCVKDYYIAMRTRLTAAQCAFGFTIDDDQRTAR